MDLSAHLVGREDVDALGAEPAPEFFVPVLDETRRRDDERSLDHRPAVVGSLVQQSPARNRSPGENKPGPCVYVFREQAKPLNQP